MTNTGLIGDRLWLQKRNHIYHYLQDHLFGGKKARMQEEGSKKNWRGGIQMQKTEAFLAKGLRAFSVLSKFKLHEARKGRPRVVHAVGRRRGPVY